jgi:hypothetical protein
MMREITVTIESGHGVDAVPAMRAIAVALNARGWHVVEKDPATKPAQWSAEVQRARSEAAMRFAPLAVISTRLRKLR